MGIPEIREREGNEKIHSQSSGKGIRGLHSWECTGRGIPAHPCWSRTFYLICSMTTSSSTSSFPSLMSSMSCQSKRPRKMRQKKKKKMGVAVVLLASVFFGGGKCLNL